MTGGWFKQNSQLKEIHSLSFQKEKKIDEVIKVYVHCTVEKQVTA